MRGKLRPKSSNSLPYRSGGFDWYRSIPFRDRITVDVVAEWLRPVRWQWFATLTFPWNVRSETADKKLKMLINALERHHRANVGFVAGKESRSRHDGSSVPWHFHLLFTSHVSLSRESIQSLWLSQIRRGRQSQADILRSGEYAVVEPYEGHQRGPEYCLKMMSEHTGDWHIHRLEYFLPGVPGTARPNHRTVRGQRRDAEKRLLGAANESRSP